MRMYKQENGCLLLKTVCALLMVFIFHVVEDTAVVL